MKDFLVTIPFAGHVHVNISAETKEEAEEKAQDVDWELDLTQLEAQCNLEPPPEDPPTVALGEYEQLTMFNQGNVCFCPSPWEIDSEEV